MGRKYKVVLIADNHFYKTEAGEYYVNGTYTQQYLKRYTSNFDELVVVGRVKSCTEGQINNLRKSGGDRISFCELPDFHGIKEYLKLRKRLYKRLITALATADAVFVRMPCILTTISIKCAKKLKKPILLDVAADPETIYLSNSPSLFERVLSKYMRVVCKNNCMTANGVSYVTGQTLQKKYPCTAMVSKEDPNYFTASISNADIAQDFFYQDRDYKELETRNAVKLIHVSNNIPINSNKGHQESISILERLNKVGIKATLTFLGDGDGVEELKNLARTKGVAEKVHFVGRVASRTLYRKLLLEHDIFVFPSHAEGLPRALIEAMSTGMICFASNVDGIPELLDENDIFDFDDICGFSNRIISVIKSLPEMTRVSKRNYAVATNYTTEVLMERFSWYCSKLKEIIALNDGLSKTYDCQGRP